MKRQKSAIETCKSLYDEYMGFQNATEAVKLPPFLLNINNKPVGIIEKQRLSLAQYRKESSEHIKMNLTTTFNGEVGLISKFIESIWTL